MRAHPHAADAQAQRSEQAAIGSICVHRQQQQHATSEDGRHLGFQKNSEKTAASACVCVCVCKRQGPELWEAMPGLDTLLCRISL